MKFGKRYSKVTVFMAMLHGVLIGIVAVALIGLLLYWTRDKEPEVTMDKEVPTSGPAVVETPVEGEEQLLQLYAKQHGAFSSAAAAAAFIAEDTSLAKAAIIRVDQNYLVWSAVGLAEGEIEVSASEGTFRKAFKANAASCSAMGAGKLQAVLSETDSAKIKSLATSEKDGKKEEGAQGFGQNIKAITDFTDDMRTIRLQLISHYSSVDDCIKITF
ncbi:hypothetical protein MKY34_12635 [Sporosarcina sp. FSL K6-1522]|uniref:hypothetical protein n=1 Tax=Sporosarcina sp. FSL K6-1522 TaxID=2921554 RepID=UPI003159C823